MDAFRQFFCLAAACAALLAPQTSYAEVFTQAEISQIFNEVKTLDTTGARPSKIRETIQGVQSVKTGTQSRAELTFPDKSLTRLGGNTIFSFQQGTRELELKQGTILFQVPKGNGGAKIRTAAITAAITGTTGFYEFSPKAGADGVIKFGILEGSATLFIKGRLGHFITVGEGQMVICPARLHDFNSTDVVYFEIQPFMRTCTLINQMGGLPLQSRLLVEQAIARQGRMFNRSKELFLTNLFIPGGGTEVVLTDINQRFTGNNPFATPPPTPRPVHATPFPTQPTTTPAPALPGQPAPPSTPSKYGPLQTITNPNPYIISSNTTILSDPKISIKGVDNFGTIFRNSSQDGALADYQFGSTSSFDQSFGYGTTYVPPAAGIANFKFSNLVITGQPTLTINGGPAEVALISVGTITSAAPGGTFNLDAFDGLFLGTVNGSITLGPELSFTSSRTGASADNYDGNGYEKGLYLEVYARGATSDVVFGSDVNFTGNRGLRLEAEHNVEVSSTIAADLVSVAAGNNFVLDSTAQITANRFKIYEATDVSVYGNGFVSAGEADITLSNPITVTQNSNFVNVNALPLDINALQTLNLTSGTVTVQGNLTSPTLTNLSLNSTSANLTINGAITLGSDSSFSEFFGTASDLTAGEGASLSSNFVYFNLYNANVSVSQGDLLTVQGLRINQGVLQYLDINANIIQVPSGLNFGTNVNLSLVAGNGITSGGSIIASNIQLLGTTTVTGDVTSANDLNFSNLTASGNVSTNTLSFNGFQGNSASLTASSINAPGGLQSFNGYDGSPATPPSPGNPGSPGYGPGDGASLTLTSTVAALAFANPSDSRAVIGSSTFNGGNAAANTAFAGGSGGSLSVTAPAGISVEVPIVATTGANGNSVTSGGTGGNVSLVSTAGPVNVSSTIDVSSNDPVNHVVSASGGKITLQSGLTTGKAIVVTNSGALRSLLNAAAPGPGGCVQITSAGGDIIFKGTAQADRGTVSMVNNGCGKIYANGVISADIVKLGALGDNGKLIIGGGTISADSTMKLYAGGSNGTLLFVGNVTLSGGTKILAANTVTINSGKVVTVNGSMASVYTNNGNFVGGNGSKSNPGSFSGPGAPTAATIHGLSGAPGF